MARETKAQRQEREAAERVARLEQEKQEYFPKLMELMERACKNNFELTVVDSKFKLSDRDSRDDFWSFEPQWSESFDLWSFTDLEYHLERKEEARQEAERKYQLRQNALAKLTAEERKELGL